MAGFNPDFDRSAFEPADTVILTRAIDEACEALGVPKDARHDREVIAARIADLARLGVSSAEALRDRVLAETRALRSL
jgi:hypothetical protein